MQLTTLTRLFAAAAVAAAASLASSGALAYSNVVVFGDSLSDSGNNALVLGANGSQVITGNTYIPVQPYGLGAYTNAQTWVNAFASGLGVPATSAAPSILGGGNNAYGGARTTVNGSVGGFPPSALTQANSYLSGFTTLPSTALYVVAIGGNDVRATGEAVAADPANAAAIIGAAAQAYALGVGSIVDALQAKGAANIIVWNSPDVGRSPYALATGTSAGASFIASTFNSLLGLRLAGEPGVTTFDIYNIFTPVFNNPGAYGLSNVTDACGAVLGCNPSQYLFWDGIHPTSAGQALIASAMLATAVPEPATLLTMAAGVVALLALRRRS